MMPRACAGAKAGAINRPFLGKPESESDSEGRPKAAEVGRRRSVAGISSTSDGQLPIRSCAGPHHYGVAPPPPYRPLRVRPRKEGR
ncbi:hypothetical protein BHE74_00016148 [Ensete ventricosum]|nr:hypothetical protein GW17_00038143 [Ensete ventricosum]RWW75802.1 hypothetical protein BHE74_00016148 [Ensete ventricosum]